MPSTRTSQPSLNKAAKPTEELLRQLQMSASDYADAIAQFCSDSAAIEGEPCKVQDVRAATFLLSQPVITTDVIRATHKMLTGHKDVDWSGVWRTVDVSVGKYKAPPHAKVDHMMRDLMTFMRLADSWKFHNLFEKIHPFVDYNGRMGRILWLHKAIWEEGYAFKLTFLHAYYYQTLTHVER